MTKKKSKAKQKPLDLDAVSPGRVSDMEPSKDLDKPFKPSAPGMVKVVNISNRCIFGMDRMRYESGDEFELPLVTAKRLMEVGLVDYA